MKTNNVEQFIMLYNVNAKAIYTSAIASTYGCSNRERVGGFKWMDELGLGKMHILQPT